MSNIERLLASTGSKFLDENVDRHTVVLEEDGRLVDVPGIRPNQSIIFKGSHYTHVADDAEGRWIYRLG